MTLTSTLTTPMASGEDLEVRAKTDNCQRLINISRLPIDQLFIEWEKFRVEFFSNPDGEENFEVYAPVINNGLPDLEEYLRECIHMWSDRMRLNRAIWVTDVAAHLHRRLRIKAIDDQLTAMTHVDEGAWYRGQYYSRLSAFIDACIESEDDFWVSVEGAKPIPFRFIDAHNLAINCWRHMTEQAEDGDCITAEELFDEAVIDYQYLAEFEFEIEPKGLEELAEAIKTYCFVNAAKWREQYEDIARTPSRTPHPASKREEYALSKLPESPGFKVLAEVLAKVEALYKEDERLFEESGEVIGLTEEWWTAQGWKHGQI
jgi:hypothetical protein